MPSLEDVGRRHIEQTILSLENAPPGVDPTFYHTLSFGGDIAEADRLRREFDMPRPPDAQQRIDEAAAAHAACIAELREERQREQMTPRPWWAFWRNQ